MDQRQFAKNLRWHVTDRERLLWRHLPAQPLDGQQFRRHQPIDPYVVDFIHFVARMIVEANGGHHDKRSEDTNRDAWLQTQGFRVLGFLNRDSRQNPEAVLTLILHSPSPNPSPRQRGEGRRSSGPAHQQPKTLFI